MLNVAIAMVMPWHMSGIETIGERHLGEQWNISEPSIFDMIFVEHHSLKNWHPYPTFSTARFSAFLLSNLPPSSPLRKSQEIDVGPAVV